MYSCSAVKLAGEIIGIQREPIGAVDSNASDVQEIWSK